MNFRGKINSILKDFISDEAERLGVLNSICRYETESTKSAFATGLFIGFVLTGVLLMYFA